jgi:glyoxylase-like metal-dependent hydrolase (beta-lactamase superfamily II)
MLATNCYLVADDAGRCAVIDPGSHTEKILKKAEEEGFTIEAILLTHGHFDHVMAAPGIQKATGAKLYIHKNDQPDLAPEVAGHRGYLREPYVMPRVDGNLEDGSEIKAGDLTFRVLHTPGHTLGSVCLLCGDLMFSGDTLFAGTCGRCDLAGGSLEQMFASLKKLAQLEGDYKVLPGHMEASTLETERQTNPYVLEGLNR